MLVLSFNHICCASRTRYVITVFTNSGGLSALRSKVMLALLPWKEEEMVTRCGCRETSFVQKIYAANEAFCERHFQEQVDCLARDNSKRSFRNLITFLDVGQNSPTSSGIVFLNAVWSHERIVLLARLDQPSGTR